MIAMSGDTVCAIGTPPPPLSNLERLHCNNYYETDTMASGSVAHNLRMVASNASLATRMHGGTTEQEQRRNMEALNRMEVSIKHTGLKLDPAQAKRMASELLESTSILRFTYDRLNRQAKHIVEKIKENDKEAEHARTEARSQFIGFRGEEELNKKLDKRREEVEKSRETTDAEVRYQRMLKHLLKRLKKELLELANDEKRLNREISSTIRSEPILRQSRLKAYQLLAREKRSLDMMLNKHTELRNLQRTKIIEAKDFIERQDRRRKKIKEKADAYRAKLNAQLDEEIRRRDEKNEKQKTELAKKQDMLMEQLAPLEDVFHKIRQRTGMTSFNADDIADIFVKQRDSATQLRMYFQELSKRLQDMTELNAKLKSMHNKLAQGTQFSESKKRFYDTLDKYEKEKHDIELSSSHHQSKINTYKVQLASCNLFIKKMHESLIGLKEREDVAPLLERPFREPLNLPNAMGELARFLKAYFPEISGNKKRNGRRVSQFDALRSSIANNTSLETIASPPSNVRVARRIATEQNGYLSGEDENDDANQQLKRKGSLSFSMSFNFDDGDLNLENDSEFGDLENGVDVEMKLSQKIRQEMKNKTKTIGMKGRKNVPRQSIMEPKKMAKDKSKSMPRSVGKKSNRVRAGQKVRKMRKRGSVSRPKDSQSRRPMKSPNVARRKTKIRGQITSPDTSPVRDDGGMSITL